MQRKCGGNGVGKLQNPQRTFTGQPASGLLSVGTDNRHLEIDGIEN